jgi:hypothetical protein
VRLAGRGVGAPKSGVSTNPGTPEARLYVISVEHFYGSDSATNHVHDDHSVVWVEGHSLVLPLALPIAARGSVRVEALAEVVAAPVAACN